MTLPDNDPAKWSYPEHTAVKHRILDGYLKTWISIRGSTSEKLGYIDGFAGRGIYEDGSDGSPIIAMKAAQHQIEKINRPQGMKKFLCYFVEKDGDNFSCLSEQVKKLGSTCKDVSCDLRKGAFEDTAKEFISLSKEGGTIPTLFFIDPFGWDGVPFEVIQGILENPNTEILLTFMISDINRFLKSSFHTDSLNKLYGGPCWKDCIGLPSKNRIDALVNVYLKVIMEETEAKHVLPFQMFDSDVRRLKYYLIFATHHPLGLRKMKDIMKKRGSGDFGFAGPAHQQSVTQAKLPMLEDMQINWILMRYGGKLLRFDTFLNEVYPLVNDPIVGALIETDYRALLKKMEEKGLVTIKRDSPRSRAINDKVILSFPVNR